MMKERRFDSMSTYKLVSDMIAQTDRIIEKNISVSAAIVKSASFMREIETPAKYAASVMPILNNSAWLQNDSIHMRSNVAFALAIDYPKLPTIPQWILELNSPVEDAMKRVFAVQSSWQSSISKILEYHSRDFLGPANIFRDLTKTSNSMADAMRISESILKFNSNISEFYNLISLDDDEYVSIDNHLTSAIANDIDGAFSDADKISIAYVAKYILDTFNAMYANYKTGNDKELFVKWITEFLDDLKKAGVRVGLIKFLVLIIPFLFTIKEMLNDDKVANETVYITESAFETVTKKVKVLKDRPDNRLKVKFTIPIGTKLTILEDKGKWIKVKFISNGIFYSGWTLNNGL